MSDIAVRAATREDADAIASIYNHYVQNSTATFEVEDVTPEAMVERIAAVQGRGLPWLVAEDSDLLEDGASDSLLGYAYVSPLGERAAYSHSLEIAIYLREGERGRGIGATLYAALLEAVRSLDPAQSVHAPVHRIYARISLPRPDSVALQERFGFRQVGLLSESGFKMGQWLDVGYWELRLDE